MRVAFLLVASAAAQTPLINEWVGGTTGTWYDAPGGEANWDLTHYPRSDETAHIPDGTTVTYTTDNKPSYMDGSVQGDSLVIDADGSLVIDSTSDDFVLGEPEFEPQHCGVADWASWSTCSAQCDTGYTARDRVLTQPRYGGNICPHGEETQECNTQPCTCQVGGTTVQHDEHYTGVGKNFCNQCHCHNGQSICTDKNCAATDQHIVCDKTRCIYGPRFLADGDNGEVKTIEWAIGQYGNNEASWPSHEMSTIVLHHQTDANGKKFTCSHTDNGDKFGEGIGAEQCVCFCKDSGDAHIWHHAQRHADQIGMGHTDAGCECQDNWTDDEGNAQTGCADASITISASHLVHKRHANWCKIKAGSCPWTAAATAESRAVSAGADWDTCTQHTRYKLKIAAEHLPSSL